MAISDLTQLNLNIQAHPELTSALRAVLDRAIALMSETLFGADDGAEQTEVRARLEELRRQLSRANEAKRITALSSECFTVFQSALEGARERQSTSDAEISSIVSLVREAVSEIAGYNESFSSELSESTERFGALTSIDDLADLKRRLAVEVDALRTFAAEREKGWQQTVNEFSGKLQQMERQLLETQVEASHDSLTGAANRRMFDRAIQKWLKLSLPRFTLAVLDLDNFKAINDTHGHPTGDSVLRAVAHILKDAVRADDVVARIGGDEFAMLCAGMTLARAESRMRAVLAQFAGGSIHDDNEHSTDLPPFTLSCGLAEFSAGDTQESLMFRADQALLDAKKRGKNRLTVRSTPSIRRLLGR